MKLSNTLIHTYIFLITFTCVATILLSQSHEERREAVDVIHYRYHLNLSDTTNAIRGNADITWIAKKSSFDFTVDLSGITDFDEGGMTISRILTAGNENRFHHSDDKVHIQLNQQVATGDTMTTTIIYSGIPKDGLVISRSKFGKRTFFGDNWPDRAHHWIPCIDHPSDKATVEFIVDCPVHYQVVATGRQIEESNLPNSLKRSHWRTDIPLPTKVMVIGVAEFAVQYLEELNGIPLSTWVYPENRENGFYDFSIARKVLEFFTGHVASYPYEKLANVQSKTRWGGMENAGNIFYFENSVTGLQQHENLIAHEIAHQWFGNSASEENWHHVWLSEGFATYFTDLYVEWAYGTRVFRDKLKNERREVIEYAQQNYTPIVDTTIADINQVLNTNSYQKAAWVLHMLRQETGDKLFWESIREYYRKFQFGNALTEDFRNVVEKVTGRDFSDFFRQWIYTAGHPEIQLTWNQNEQGEVALIVHQVQNEAGFTFPLRLRLHLSNAGSLDKRMHITSREEVLQFELDNPISSIQLDPETELLFEGYVVKSGE